VLIPSSKLYHLRISSCSLNRYHIGTLDAIGSPAAYRILQLTSLSFRANMIALACSAALPTIGSMITLMNETGTFHEAEAPYHKEVETLVQHDLSRVPIS
jgi:hypothetical protein